MMKARLVDVAARAGVAPNTASAILNKRSDSWASEATRERVLKAAIELNYQPNKAALGVRLGRFNTIGLVVPDLHNPFFPVLADYLGSAIKAHGFDLILEHTGNELGSEQRVYQSILHRQVDGAVLIVSDLELHRPFLAKLARSGPPVVALAGKTVPMPVDSVITDYSRGFSQAVDHLMRLGHQRFAFLCALAKGQDDGGRQDLYRALLRAKGVADENALFARCEPQVASARDAFLGLLRKTGASHPTALIAINDLSAIGAMRAIAEYKLAVPKDISVIGLDNIPLGEFLPVSLTTISQPIEEMAKCAAELLVKRINGEHRNRSEQVVLSTNLILRESTGKPKL